MRAYISVSVVISLLLSVPSHSQDSLDTRSSMTGLGGVLVNVERLAPEIEDKGITPFVLAVEIESRLKEAGIPTLTPDSPQFFPGFPTLYVEVNAMIDEYSDRCTWAVRMDLTQAVRMERDSSSLALIASTWSVGGVGFVMKDWRKAIIDDVISYTDQFIEAFAGANPEGIEP